MLLENTDTRFGMSLSLCLLPLTILIMSPLFYNYASSDIFAYVSDEEYNAMQWISRNTPATSYILTDPSSGFLVRGLSLRNASTYFMLPDGRMPADSSLLYPNLESDLHRFFSSQSLSDSLLHLRAISFEQTYVMVTSRTVYWADSSVEAVIYRPTMSGNYTSVTWKLRPPYFVELYSSNTVRIFQPDRSLS